MAMVHGRFQSSTVPRIIGSLRFESCLVNRLDMRAIFYLIISSGTGMTRTIAAVIAYVSVL